MNLFEAVAARVPFVIDHPYGGLRILAECFPWPAGGIVYADVFWPDADSRPPFHVVEGELQKVCGGYRVINREHGNIDIRPVHPGHRRWREWDGWLNHYLPEHPEATTAAAKAAIDRAFAN